MNFTKVLIVRLFIIMMISVANNNATNGEKISCEWKCRLACIFNPICTDICIKNYCPHSISSKEFNCKLACFIQHCYKFKQGIILSMFFFNSYGSVGLN